MERNRETRGEGTRSRSRRAESVQRLVEILVREKKISKKKRKRVSHCDSDDKRRDSLTANNGARVRKC